MLKAFLFDMDGVLADTESEAVKRRYDKFLIEYFGQDLWSRVQFNSGTSIKGIVDAFVQVGWTGSYEDFHAVNIVRESPIYLNTPLSPGIEDLIDYLDEKGYRLGVVSNSPQEWIKQLTNRLRNKDKLLIGLSVNNHLKLAAKPASDAYLYAMKELETIPENTFILEDSQTGIQAAKNSGAHTICFTAYTKPESRPKDAEYYAATMAEVQEIVDKYGRP